MISFTSVLMIPDILAIEIKYTGFEDIYAYAFTKLGKSSAYSIYLMILFIGTSIFSICTNTILNFFIIRGYKQFIGRKIALTNCRVKNTASLLKYQKGVTRVIIFMNAYYTVIGIFPIVSLMLFKIQTIYGVFYHPFTNILRGIAYSLLLWSYASDVFIFMAYDKNLRNEWKKMWAQVI